MSRNLRAALMVVAVVLHGHTASWAKLPSETPRFDMWTVDQPLNRGFVDVGVTFAVAEHRDRVYIGGAFTQVGPPTARFAVMDELTAAVNASLPRIGGGEVHAIQPDGVGGWYVGGAFETIDGQPQRGLAHYLADGTLHAGWNPDVHGTVYDMAIAGDKLYIAGDIGLVGGSPREGLAAIELATGAVYEWWIPVADAPVTAIEIVDSVVYVAGFFEELTFQPRRSLGAIDLDTGAILPWDPNPQASFENPAGGARTLKASGTTLYASGQFGQIAGQARERLAAFDTTTGLLTSWNPGINSPGGAATEIAVDGSTVYLGGRFTLVANQPRTHLAAVDAITGAVLPFAPVPNGTEGTTVEVHSIAVADGVLYAGGHFTHVDAEERYHVAAMNATTGAVLNWFTPASGPFSTHVYAVAADGDAVAAGGNFDMAGGAKRSRLAALNLSTGALDPSWNASVEGGKVHALVEAGSIVYAAGEFTTANGQPRTKVAAFDAETGDLIAGFQTTVSGFITRLAHKPGILYLGGRFGSVDGLGRVNLAAINDQTGQVIASWDGGVGLPNPEWVEDLELTPDGSVLYVGGGFGTAGNGTDTGSWLANPRVAAFDADTGQLLDFMVSPNDKVFTLIPEADRVWVGGWFRWFDVTAGTVTRTGVTWIDVANEFPGLWSTWLGGGGVPNGVYALAMQGTTIYMGGLFTKLKGGWSGGSAPQDYSWRPWLAAMDADWPAVLDWEPNPSGSVGELEVTESALYVGGGFTTMGGIRHPYFAIFPFNRSDIDGDGDVDLVDYVLFADCMSGPNVATPPPGCTLEQFSDADLDSDNDVDLADFSQFVVAFTGS